MELQLFNEDCLEAMKNIPDCSIDCCITDPPYRMLPSGTAGVTKQGVKRPVGMLGGQYAKKGTLFKHNSIHFNEWFKELYRVMKEGTHVYTMSNARNLKEMWQEAENAGFKFVNLLVWVKNNRTPNQYYMQQAEYILLLRKGKARSINDCGTSNIININNVRCKEHPTEKPVDLMQLLVENSTNEGETVLDLFMGSGSTGVACKNTNRNFIGIELDKEYFDIAEKRIKSA